MSVDAEEYENERIIESMNNVSSYQLVHMQLGAVMLGIIITIPRSECAKFKEKNNEKYKDLLKLINGKLSTILQREQNRKNEKKKKGKGKKAKYQIISGESVKFAAKLEKKDAPYYFVQDLCNCVKA